MLVGLSKEAQITKELSNRIVNAQKPIRILDAIKWDDSIKRDFFSKNCQEPPSVSLEYYKKYPLIFNPEEKIEEFRAIERDITKNLGQFNPVGEIMMRMCREYRMVVRMLMARGTPEFSQLSQNLYGAADEVFYPGGPSVHDVAEIFSEVTPKIESYTTNELDEKNIDSAKAAEILRVRLQNYFTEQEEPIQVEVTDEVVADAAAGAEVLKLRSNAMFSERQLRLLEVHEGWVHLGTTLNGRAQPVCTFLSKGPPSSTVTQEGLAVLMELFTFREYPERLRRLANRVVTISMVDKGANFLDIFHYFQEQGYGDENSYETSVRIFRGSTPDGLPFTKDLSYTKGVVMIFNYIRLAIQRGLLDRIPLLFLGKTTLGDLHSWSDLIDKKIVVRPKYVPPQFFDMSGLASWVSYSLFLNKINLQKLAENYKQIL
ncbi:MAG: flavohemoglobin expression-modulating QEGLA motif protein [Proteobacteria bacterium]|nr:flavohemoglobin expression-modulating QEGLA motif protein [Pseudomonadota bacterium]